MNKCNQEFLERNGISIEEVCSKTDSHIYSREEINPIIAKYGFYKKDEKKMISVADVVGYDTEFRRVNTNIFLSLDSFFDNHGDGYHERSISMLEYDKNNIIIGLKQSFINQPISIVETGEGTYAVLRNGLHRYTLLRIFYLSEVAKANNDKEKLDEIAQKYTIPTTVTAIDLEKTYCKYLLTKIKAENDEWRVKDIKTQYDSNYNETENVIVIYANGVKEDLSKEMLLLLTKERIEEDKEYSNNYPELQKMYNKYLSFQKFIDEEFSDLISLEKTQKNEKGLNEND